MAMTPERERLRRRAVKLHAEGLSVSSISYRLKVTTGSVIRWTNPEARERDRLASLIRKKSYQGVCESCGGPTTGCNGPGNAPRVCALCYHTVNETKYWTAERVVEAIRVWAGETGRPPKAYEWRKSGPGKQWPPASSVYRSTQRSSAPFESWGEAIEASGFPRPLRGDYVRTEEIRRKLGLSRTVWSKEAVIEAIKAWVEEHGQPPSRSDWSHYERGVHPVTETTQRIFGTWSAAIRAAGFEPRKAGRRRPKPLVRS